jgi:hypothetical protein
VEELEKQEVVERIAFERGRQVGVGGGEAPGPASVVGDLLTADNTEAVYDAYFRGQVYGERQAIHEFEGED